MEILSNNECSDVIAWLPLGKAFIIYKQNRFIDEILPKYFKKSKYTSFTRKLNHWGFNRVIRGPDTGAYYHHLFQRGSMTLSSKTICSSIEFLSKINLKSKAHFSSALHITVLAANTKNAIIPSPDLSYTAIQASIDILRKRINVDSISGLQSNTKMLLSLAEQVQSSMQHFPSPKSNSDMSQVTKCATAA